MPSGERVVKTNPARSYAVVVVLVMAAVSFVAAVMSVWAVTRPSESRVV